MPHALRERPPRGCAPCRLSANPDPERGRRSSNVLRNRGGRDLLLEALNEGAGGKSGGHGNRISNRFCRRAAVPHDGQTGEANERRSAVLRVIDTASETPKCPPREQITDLARKCAAQLVAEQRLD